MGEHTQTMVLDRVTKNAARFAAKPEPGQAAAVSTVYVQRWALPESFASLPLGDVEGSDETITLTISA